MTSQNQNPKELLAKGDLESALERLVQLTEHAGEADLRQRVLALSGQFAALKKQHLSGLLEDKDYRLQLNRITAAVAEIVDSNVKSFSEGASKSIQKENSQSLPFWRKWRFWAWLIPVMLAVLEVLFGALSYLLQSGNPSPKESTTTVKSLTDPGCKFPIKFDSTHLYILITRFEDNANVDIETKCYGEEIASRIDQIKNAESLPIRICYVDAESPFLSDEAERLRDYYHADLIIWGSLRDARPDCQSDGFCIKYQASQTLVLYAGGQVSQKVDNEYQANISDKDIEEGLINMGRESFDAWIIGMSNLKIGRKKPEFYRISPDWPIERQAGEYATRADMFFRLGLFEKTVQDYEQAIRLIPSAVFYNNRAVANERLGRLHLSISDCDKAIQLDSNFAPAHQSRGYANLKLGLFNVAIDNYTKAIKLNPNDFKSYNDRGSAKHYLEQFASAISDYDKAIQLNPQDAGGFNNRAVTKHTLKQYDEAFADYEKAIELNPTYATAYINRGSLKRDLHRHKEAIEDLGKAIQLDSNNIQAYDFRGASNYDLGLYQDAIIDLDKYIRLDSNNAGVYSVRGYSKIKLDRHKDAILDFDKSIKLQVNNAIGYDNRGCAKSKIGDYTGAIVDFDRAIQLDPKDADYYFNRAVAKNALGQYQAAIDDFDKVFKLYPNAWVYNERGLSKVNLGRYTEGIADFDRAIKINPNDPNAYRNKADAYWKQEAYFAASINSWQAFRVQNLPGWKLHATWIFIVGLFIFLRYRGRVQNIIQYWKQLIKRKSTRQQKRHSKRKKRI